MQIIINSFVLPLSILIWIFSNAGLNAPAQGSPLGEFQVPDSNADRDGGSSQQRPNIILLNLDDADRDLFSDEILSEYLPSFRRLARQGIQLKNCHVTTPLCGPSRTCLLRGQYAHRTGIKTNRATGRLNNGFSGGFELFLERGFGEEHLGSWLQRAGYRTMMVGKYTHGPVNTKQVAGWHDLHISFGGDYFGPNLYSSRLPAGRRRFNSDKSLYRANQETEAAVWMLKQHANRISNQTPQQPFFLYIAPLAPHKPAANGAMLPKHLAEVANEIRLPHTPDLNEVDVSDKPVHLQVDKLTADEMHSIKEENRKRLVSLIPVDQLLKQVLDTLQTGSMNENTYIFLTSDHGFQLGHNRMVAKKLPFDRNTRVPMWVAGPGIQANSQANHLTSHIDLAPTFLDLAGATPPIEFDGQSLTSILFEPTTIDSADFRQSLLIEHWETKSHRGSDIPATYSSLHSGKTIYTEWSNGSREFYDLDSDPFQVSNRFDQISPGVQQRLSSELHDLKSGMDQPIVTIATQGHISFQPTLLGCAEDDSGVSSVEMEIINRANGQYYSGQAWTESPANVKAKLMNQDGLLTDWRINLDLTDIGADGFVEIRVRSRNQRGQVSETVTAEFRVDGIEPKTELKQQLNGSIVSSPVLLSGTATDDHQVRGVELRLHRSADGKNWNGNSWVSNQAKFRKRVDKAGNWQTQIDLPSGNYRFWASAIDEAGNVDSSPAEQHFSVN